MQAKDIPQLLRFKYAYGEPSAKARIRLEPEDFQVDELLPFEPSCEGQHRMLLVQKRNTNTDWVARQLARFVGIRAQDVSYAGLKDRNAVTTQWFSVDLAGKAEPDWPAFDCEEYRILSVQPHHKKLRRGTLKGNAFTITLKQLEGDKQQLEQRLLHIQQNGVPNYFGEQRFGHGGDNLLHAWEMLLGEKKVKDRNRRGIYLSAARSLIYNRVLSRRVEEASWNQIIDGEAAILDGSGSYFIAERVDDEIRRRLIEWDIHPSAPMWGQGGLPTLALAHALEEQVCRELSEWLPGLEGAGLKQERRALRLRVADLQWAWPDEETLCLRFFLPAGSYATSVIRELTALK